MIFKIFDFWGIVRGFEKDFMDSIATHKIVTVKRDFTNLFFAYFMRSLSKLFEEDKTFKVVYVEGVKSPEFCDHYYVEEMEVFFGTFYNRISRLFPSIFFRHETVLNGTYLPEDLDHEIVEKIIRLGTGSVSFLKIRKELQKRVGRLNEHIRIQNFHEI